MGVAWVFETDKTVEQIARTLEAEGGKKVGVYTVDLTPYKPPEKVQSVINRMYVVHHSGYPQSTFLLGPDSSYRYECSSEGQSVYPAQELKPEYPRAVADRGFDMILSRLTSGLVVDNNAKFTVTGDEYNVVDYTVRFGQATMGVSSKGVVVEVDYGPCFVASECYNMLYEFCEMFFPEEKVNRSPSRLQPEPYTVLDTASQYLDVFIKMCRRLGPYVPPGRPQPQPSTEQDHDSEASAAGPSSELFPAEPFISGFFPFGASNFGSTVIGSSSSGSSAAGPSTSGTFSAPKTPAAGSRKKS